jgi:CheY-like chemotaxis protein
MFCSVIALSADCQESTKELCLSAGMNGFLTKPMRPGRLSGSTVEQSAHAVVPIGDLPSLLRTYASNENPASGSL